MSAMWTYTIWTEPESEQRLTKAVANNYSIAGVLKELGLTPAGGNYQNIKYHINRLELDTKHFKGQGHNRGNVTHPNNTNQRVTVKKFLITERGHRCEKCQLEEWNNLPIPLELEHQDGDNNNNDMTNVFLLCCNCHAQTKTWRRMKRKVPSGYSPIGRRQRP